MLSTLAIKSNTICSWRNCINQQMMQGGDYPHCSITVSATYFRIKYGKYHQLWSVSLSYNSTVPGVCDEALEDETERGFVTKRTCITTQCAFWHQSGHWKTDLTDLQCYIALHLQIHLIRIGRLIWLIWRDGGREGKWSVTGEETGKRFLRSQTLGFIPTLSVSNQHRKSFSYKW